MKLAHWRLDTLAGWTMANIVTAIMLVVALNAAVIGFANVWSRPDLLEGGLPQQMAIVLRVMEATPTSERSRIAVAVTQNSEYGVHWYATRAEVPMPPITQEDAKSFKEPLYKVLGRRRIEACDREFDDPEGTSEKGRYALAMQQDDGSWLLFDTHERIWGVQRETRIIVMSLFVLISSVLVAAVASRRLSRPMRRLANAAERFGADVQAPPIAPQGPLEIQAAMRAFNAMQERIQRFVRDRTEMLAAISHDLRAPLTRLRLRGEFIDDPEQQRKLLNDVDEMRSMVDAALAFFQGDGEEEPVTRFDLAGLVNTVIDDCRDEGGDMTYEGPDRLIFVGRPKALKRAIANVVGNAVRYGGATTVGLVQADDTIDIRVRDHGPGIDEALQETVFRPFFRTESSRNRHTGGVGLGLPTARSIVRAHGGDVSLRNVTGGLQATLRLPLPPRES